VDVDWVADHIGPNTVALVGSAGTYPHGVIDPIPELGQLALEHGIGLHVDGCLGGFILAWAKECGYDHTPFDLAVPGVTSISADTHKYGYALKGSSVLLFRPKELRREQYLLIDGWPGGAYASPGMGGSRSGGLIAATWASMLSFGRSGYREIARQIFRTADEIRAAVVANPELQLVGDSLWNIAFTSDEFNIFHVNDALGDLGWRMNALQLPPALHFCVTRPNTQPGVTEDFARDLARAVSYAKAPPSPKPRSGAMYAGDATGAGRPPVDQLRETSANRLDAIHEVGPLS
jgi:glutamate/tyrosine decarboxylase-like PLP-dependent enzyme